MIYNRGQAADYDNWSRLGNPGWSYPEILPYFKRSEKRIGSGDPEYRGMNGQLPITDMAWDHPLSTAFIEAAQSLGIPRNEDYNGESQYGVGVCQSNVDARRRKSSARAFLYPMLKNGAIDLRTDVHVLKILLEGKRATGVSYKLGDKVHSVRARREVIVTAGSINSPKLLQLSGIGSGEVLQRAGIPVAHDLPGVGENLRDHFGARLVARVKPGVRTINETARGASLVWQMGRWLMGKGSVLHLGPIQAYLFGKSRADLESPDFTIGLTSAMSKLGVPAQLDDNSGLTLGGWQSRPNSAGYVRAKSSDPFALPEIQPNYLADERDRQVEAEHRHALLVDADRGHRRDHESVEHERHPEELARVELAVRGHQHAPGLHEVVRGREPRQRLSVSAVHRAPRIVVLTLPAPTAATRPSTSRTSRMKRSSRLSRISRTPMIA
jgi:choline dehydrogenase